MISSKRKSQKLIHSRNGYFKMIKVLFNVRPDYLTILGGDSIQMLKTAAALRKINVEVDISTELMPKLDNYDLVHIFNTTNISDTFIQCKNAKEKNKPIVLSPIYWHMNEYNKRGRCNIFLRMLYHLPKNDRLLLRLKKIRGLWVANEKVFCQTHDTKLFNEEQQRFVIDNSNILLPNSEMEMEMIRKDFNVLPKYLIVPNAADDIFIGASVDNFIKENKSHGLDENKFVLCVSSINDRKNTLRLIKAINGTNLKLVIIGMGNPYRPAYYIKCRKAAKDNVVFLGHMDHDSLGSAYAAAKVHILASWYETPGLANLEAGLAGCNIVSTDRGSTKEYFRDFVEYCEPTSISSIRNAILKAFDKPKTEHLKLYISKHYTWDKAAEYTLEAYKQVLKNNEDSPVVRNEA